MTDVNFNHGRQSRMARICGLLLVTVLSLSAGAPEAAAGFWVKRDWNRVQIVTPGTRTTVRLYKDRAPRGKRKFSGRFHSATVDSVTLLLPGGHTRTLPKQDVRKVKIRRPFKKRYQGWVTAGAGTAVGVPMMMGGDFNAKGKLLVAAVVIAAPTAFAFLAAPRMGDIYFVPGERRDEAAGAKRKSRR